MPRACTAFFLLLAQGCGYELSVGQGRLPDGSRRLLIPVASNQTTDAWTAAYLTERLRVESDRLGLEERAGGAELRARILDVRAVPRAVAMMGGRTQTREQEVVVAVRLSLRLLDGRKLSDTLVGRESYLSTAELRGTDSNRQMALRLCLDRLAAEALNRIGRGF